MSGFDALYWWIDRWRKSAAYMDMTLEEQGAYRNLLDEATLRGGALGRKIMSDQTPARDPLAGIAAKLDAIAERARRIYAQLFGRLPIDMTDADKSAVAAASDELEAIFATVAALREAVVPPPAKCHWLRERLDDGSVYWDTQCGNAWTEDRQRMQFCPFCGGGIVNKLSLQASPASAPERK